MRRRDFIALLGGSAAWPVMARAQQSIPVIGFLNTASPEASSNLLLAFREGLAEAGYVEGRNVLIEYRWAEGRPDRLPKLAGDLVRRQVSVIAATGGSPAPLAAKAATHVIPIVFQVGVDPVEIGLVTSLNRPGGTITGATMLADELGSKRLEILHEIVPDARLIGAILKPGAAGAPRLTHDLSMAAQALELRTHIVEVSSEHDFEAAFIELAKLRVGALVIVADPLFNGQSEQLAKLTVSYKIPSIYQFRDFAAAGGLLSYGGSISDAYHQAGVYSGRILSGDKAGDLPVQRSTKVEFFINLQTAKMLALNIPLPLLGRADEVIE